MCFVLDANCFSSVFNSTSPDHDKFEPLRYWLMECDGTSLVFGGDTYLKELGRLSNYLGLLTELERNSKISKIDTSVVNSEESRIAACLNNSSCNDQHLIAIVCASGCRILASYDKKADKFIKQNNLYPKSIKKPKIYRDSCHAKLLCKNNIVPLKNLA